MLAGGSFSTFTLAGYQSQGVSGEGSAFFLLASSAALRITPVGGLGSLYYPQTGYPSRIGSQSSRLTFPALIVANPTGRSVTFVLWVGYEQVAQNIQYPDGLLAGPIEGLSILAVTGVPQALSANQILCKAGSFYGYKAMSSSAGPTANSANVYVGNSLAYQATLLGSGSAIAVANYDLASVYAVGTAGDGVFWSVV